MTLTRQGAFAIPPDHIHFAKTAHLAIRGAVCYSRGIEMELQFATCAFGHYNIKIPLYYYSQVLME